MAIYLADKRNIPSAAQPAGRQSEPNVNEPEIAMPARSDTPASGEDGHFERHRGEWSRGSAAGGAAIQENHKFVQAEEIVGLDTANTIVRESTRPKRIFLHDLALTMVAEAGTIVSGLLLTSMISRWMGAQPLSEYLLLRRVLGWIVAGALLGVDTAVPRFIAFAAGHVEAAGHGEQEQPAYFMAGAICMVFGAVVAGGLLVAYRTVCAGWFFGDSRETGLVIALAMLLIGFAIHRAFAGYYRGLLDMRRANLLVLLNSALLPVVVVLILFRTQPIGMMMFITGAVMVVISMLFSWPVVRRLLHGGALANLRARSTELLKYGIPRVPGEFASAALLALGPILAAHYMKLAEVSPLLLGLNLLLVIGYAAGPLGIILLSKVSMMLGQNQHKEVQLRMRLLVVGILEVSAFTCMQLVVFADVVVRAWVGPGFESQMDVIRLVLLAIPFYLFYVGLRSTIDAATVKPLNTLNVLMSLGVYLALIAGWITCFHGRSLLVGVAGSLLASEILLSLLTAHTFRKFYGLDIPWRRLGPSFAAAVLLGGAAFALREFMSAPISLPIAALAEVVFAALYVAVLAKRRSGWIVYTWNVGVLRREDWPVSAARP